MRTGTPRRSPREDRGRRGKRQTQMTGGERKRRREIPLYAGRPFAGAKGKKESAGSARNDGRGGASSQEFRSVDTRTLAP